MSVSITIRNVPNETRDELAARAAKSGRSLQEFLLAELKEAAAKPSLADALAEIRARARTYPAVSTAELIENLDADHR